MGEIKHTPGPWKIEKIVSPSHPGPYYEIQYGDDGECVAEFVHEEADAKLIAAAPDMLAALMAISSNPHAALEDVIYDVREREGDGWQGSSVLQWSNAVKMINDAIKKATS